MELQVDAVLQPQHLEFVFGKFAGQATLHLIAKFVDAFVDEGTVEFIIFIHERRALCRNRKFDGDALEPDLFAQIAGLDLARVLDFDRRDIGADRADIVGDGFGE